MGSLLKSTLNTRVLPIGGMRYIRSDVPLRLTEEEMEGYKITPKGMVQIYLKQDIPYEVLKQIFAETLV